MNHGKKQDHMITKASNPDPETQAEYQPVPIAGSKGRRTAAIVEGHVRFEDGQSAVHGLHSPSRGHEETP